MSERYHDGSRELQDRFDTRRLADRLQHRVVRETIGLEDREFIERMDMFLLASADAAGQPQCSYKGGDPGFLRVVDERTLAFPNYDGNCPRYIHRMALVERSAYVPRKGAPPPVPEWKRGEPAEGALPAGDPAAEPSAT